MNESKHRVILPVEDYLELKAQAKVKLVALDPEDPILELYNDALTAMYYTVAHKTPEIAAHKTFEVGDFRFYFDGKNLKFEKIIRSKGTDPNLKADI